MKLFQSTLPRRERRTCRYIQCHWNDISIHAPAKGATGRFGNARYYYRFQSTLPRRERPDFYLVDNIVTFRFQSTLPRRERRSCLSV